MKRLDALESRHREGLISRSSEPGSRSTSRRHGHGSRSKRRHGSEHSSGVASAPASRGDMASETFSPLPSAMPMGFFEAPQTEPARGWLSRTPSAGELDTPPRAKGLARTLQTPDRSLSTPTLHSSGGGKPPAVPKRRSLGSRERLAPEWESSVLSLSPLLSEEEHHTSAPSRARPKGSPLSSPERHKGLLSPQIAYPAQPQAMPTLPMGPFLGVNPSVWSARSSDSNSVQPKEELLPAASRREVPHSEIPDHCRTLPAGGSHTRTSACSRHSGSGKSLAVPGKSLSRPRRRHNSATPDLGAGVGGTPPDPSRRRTGSAAPGGAQRNANAKTAEVSYISVTEQLDGAFDSGARQTNDLLDNTSEVGEQSYGWDEHEEDSVDCHVFASSLPGSKGKVHASLSCVKGSRGVKALSLSTSTVDLHAEMRAATMQMTLNAPDSVKGTYFTWVKGDMLGQGSLGSVFKALDQGTGQIFAVKEVRIDVRDKADVKFRAALENEIDICKDLKHDRIVSYLGHDTIETRLYIYLEYMPGGSLTQVLSQFGPFEESLIATYTRDLLQGLDYLHTSNPVVLHRDVKGANILVGLDCRVKLSDFGCSKRTADTLSMSLRGSIPWMAPEVIQQTGYGRRSDIWSLGCVVIEMATARHPWGNFDNPMAAMVKIGMSNLTPPLPEVLSDQGKDFISQCTQRDKNQRPLAAMMLEHDLVRDLCDPT